jgi:hypothetical protein
MWGLPLPATGTTATTPADGGSRDGGGSVDAGRDATTTQ